MPRKSKQAKRTKKQNNKKVITVLIVVIAAILVIGFAVGWSALFAGVQNFFSQSNISSVEQSCKVACEAGDEYSFCVIQRVVTRGDEADIAGKACVELVEQGLISKCGNIECEASCRGTAKQCSEFAKSDLDCNFQEGCKHDYKGECIGNPEAASCNTLTTKQFCEKQQGCTWK